MLASFIVGQNNLYVSAGILDSYSGRKLKLLRYWRFVGDRLRPQKTSLINVRL
jgi:hypothetical protein